MREARLEARFQTAVRRAGGRVVKMIPTVDKGVPDRLVLAPGGRLYLVELKTETGVLSPAQRVWHRKAAELGVTVTVLSGAQETDAWVAETLGEG